jgi:hypothetical protein
MLGTREARGQQRNVFFKIQTYNKDAIPPLQTRGTRI